MMNSLLKGLSPLSSDNRGWNTQNLVTEHITRVEADGGIIESEAVLLQTMNSLRDIYKIKNDDDFKAKLPVTLDPAVFGYKVGTGALSTLGWAANKLYSINSDGDRVQATAGSQPLLLRHNDIDGNYVYFPRIAASTGNPAISTQANNLMPYTQASDTLILTAKVLFTNQTANSYDSIIFCAGCGISYKNISANKLIRFGTSGGASADSTQYTPSATVPHFVRIIAEPAGLTYQWSANGLAWTTLDTGVAFPAAGTNANIFIGYTKTRTANAGNVYYAKLENVTQSKVVTFDVNDWNPLVSETGWTSSEADETIWQLSQTIDATSNLRMTLVDRTLAHGNGVAHIMQGNINISQPHTIYSWMRRRGVGPLLGMAATSSISNDGTNLTLNNGTALNIANSGVLRQFVTAESNGANSKIRVNAGADTTGDAGTTDGTYLDLFANGATFGCHSLKMLIVSVASDSDAIKTAMYNYFQ